MKLPLLLAVAVAISCSLLSCSTTSEATSASVTSGSMTTVSEPSPDEIGIEVKLLAGRSSKIDHLLGPNGTRIVSADEAQALLEVVARDGRVISRPRIFVAPAGVASMVNSQKTAYVQDYDADAKPIMGIVEAGCWLTATPTLVAGGAVEVAFTVEVAGLARPMRDAQLTLPRNGQVVTVQLPELEKHKITTSVVLGVDDVAVISFEPVPGEDSVRAVVLRAIGGRE